MVHGGGAGFDVDKPVAEARGYVGKPETCPSPVVNAKRCPSGRHIHSLGLFGFLRDKQGMRRR